MKLIIVLIFMLVIAMLIMQGIVYFKVNRLVSTTRRFNKKVIQGQSSINDKLRCIDASIKDSTVTIANDFYKDMSNLNPDDNFVRTQLSKEAKPC